MTDLRAQTELVLASASPRRRELLALAGVPHQTIVSQVVEQALEHETASQFVQRTAREKAHEVAQRCPESTWVLGADTSVIVDEQVLGKPQDRADGQRMLSLLSDRSHQVMTGVSLCQAGTERSLELLAQTQVTFRHLDAQVIDAYLATGEPQDKAGAYGIQGRGAMLVKSIHGSYTNVVGLPLCETVELLEQAGIWQPFAGGSSR